MESSIKIMIAVLACVLLISGCNQTTRTAYTDKTTNSANPAGINTQGAPQDNGIDAGVTVDNPADPGTLDNISVSDSVP